MGTQILNGAKAKDLWKPLLDVDEEDIRHMKSKLSCKETISSLRATTPCAICLSKWIRDGGMEYAAVP